MTMTAVTVHATWYLLPRLTFQVSFNSLKDRRPIKTHSGCSVRRDSSTNVRFSWNDNATGQGVGLVTAVQWSQPSEVNTSSLLFL